MDYTTTEELLLSDGFLNWYQQSDEGETQRWNKWIAGSSEHQHLVNEAIQILRLIRSQEKRKTDEQDITEVVKQLLKTIKEEKDIVNPSDKSLRQN